MRHTRRIAQSLFCLAAAYLVVAAPLVADEVLLTKDQIIEQLQLRDEQPLTRALILGGGQAPAATPEVPGWLKNSRITFPFDSAELTDQARLQLDILAEALLDPRLATDSFEIAGHTDAVGSPSYNLRLSEQRAQAARDYLVYQRGVPAERLLPRGFGQEQLFNPTAPDGAENRRVELLNLGG